MPKPSVLIGTPMMRGQLEPENYLSCLAARRYLDRIGIESHVMTNESSVISYSRNAIAERLMHDYLMWIDSDMQFPPYGITRLMEREKDIIGGLYYRKLKPYFPLVFKLNDNGYFQTMYTLPDDLVFEVDGIATGFLLIHRRVFEAFTPDAVKELGEPFRLGSGPNGKEEGEDISFCRRAKKLGFSIWCDQTIPLAHWGKKAYTRDDYQEAIQVADWMERKETYNNDIEGWMTKTELNWLWSAASTMDSVVEIGSWKGRSTHALLSGCARGTVYAVDHWRGSPDETAGPHREAAERDIFALDFMANVGSFPNLKPMRMSSLEAAARFADKSVDMVFIDGSHNYADVRNDIEAWLPKTRKLICGHDFNIFSVAEAVTERFGIPDTADSIWIKKLA